MCWCRAFPVNDAMRCDASLTGVFIYLIIARGFLILSPSLSPTLPHHLEHILLFQDLNSLVDSS